MFVILTRKRKPNSIERERKKIDQEIEFQLFVETYQLVEPLIKERDAVYESLTYSSELYVPAVLIWKTGRNMQEQTVFLGNIPIMNSFGTSIVNGIYRIVIDQLRF